MNILNNAIRKQNSIDAHRTNKLSEKLSHTTNASGLFRRQVKISNSSSASSKIPIITDNTR
jgi:hypothetical protein